jgi:hypothetical protein
MLQFGDSGPGDSLCRQLFERLKARNLHKQIFSERLQDLQNPEIRERLLAISKPENDELRGRIEGSIAELLRQELKLEVDKRIVILHGFNVQSVRTSSRNDEASIMIDCPPTPRPFEEYSALFQSIKEGYADGEIAVYAPVSWETRAERKSIRTKLLEPIHSEIERLTMEALKREQPMEAESPTGTANR